jgi:DHA2 family multidrug resistance protein
MAVVLAPAIGPTLGGWITDNYDWRWIFFINLPVGIISLLLTHRMIEDPPHLIEEKKRAWARGLSIDYIGLGPIALGLGTLQVVLDKGQEDDWFASTFITWFAIIAIISLIAFAIWEWLRKDPIVDVRMLGRRTFGIANVLMFTVGVVLYGTTVLLPQFTQTLLGYTAERAGMALSPGGFAIIVVMPLVGRLTSRIDGRKLIAYGLAVSGLALYHMTTLDLNVDFRTVMLDRVYQALGLAFLFIPINTMSYVGVAPEDNNQVSGIINLFRNLGGSVGISIVSTLIARCAQIHQDTLSLHTNNYRSAFTSTVNGLANAYIDSGSSPADAAHHGLAKFYMSMQSQASMLAYLDTLWLLAMACFAIIPLVFWPTDEEESAR